MEAITTLTSTTVVIPDPDIDTDQIIPARFLTTTTREGLGKHLFANWRYLPDGSPNPDFMLNRSGAAAARILIAGNNFGCGSSREHAPWALLDHGFRAVLSTRIADIFRSNSLKNGLLSLEIDADLHDWLLNHPGVEVTIDLTTCTLVVPDRAPFHFEMDAFARHCLMQGVDQLGFLSGQEQAIRAFEAGRE
jgi:3-isopropylmalate/(R)-2-methylmalate dehydratase small subunit